MIKGSLRYGKIVVTDRLGVGGLKNMRNQMVERGISQINNWNWGDILVARWNLMQWKLHVIYESNSFNDS